MTISNLLVIFLILHGSLNGLPKSDLRIGLPEFWTATIKNTLLLQLTTKSKNERGRIHQLSSSKDEPGKGSNMKSPRRILSHISKREVDIFQLEESMSDEERQQLRLLNEQNKCRHLQSLEIETGEDSCPAFWDGALCWSRTPPGQIVEQQCPHYVHGFNHKGKATRSCDGSGSWQVNEATNDTWTNYTQCLRQPFDALSRGTNNMFEPHLANIKLITKTGYSVSLATLILAFLILTCNKRLRCPRNSLHLHLFFSFMIRSSIFLIKDAYFQLDSETDAKSDLLDSLSDSNSTLDGLLSSHNDSSMSQSMELSSRDLVLDSANSPSCKAFTVVWQYSLLANYNWILMEGIYLHNLVFLHIFNDNSSILKYALAGWSLPLVFIIPWTFVRIFLEDTLCWTTNENLYIYWIVRGPVTLSIIMNTMFFIRITRVLFVKMFNPSGLGSLVQQYNYRKWFRSTLVLVPLFGVHHVFLLLFNSFSLLDEILEVIWLYTDLSFTSFQGFFVAMLYCFLNGEVQSELSNFWSSHGCRVSRNSIDNSIQIQCHHFTDHGAHNNMPNSVTCHSMLNHSTSHLAKITSSMTLPMRRSSGNNNNMIDLKMSSMNRSLEPSPKSPQKLTVKSQSHESCFMIRPGADDQERI